MKETQTVTFQERFRKLREETLNHPVVAKFLEENKNQITQDSVELGMSKLYEFISQYGKCQCNNVSNCTNVQKGYIPNLSIHNGDIHVFYTKCNQLINEEQQAELAKMVTSMYIPKNLLNADITSIDLDNDNGDIDEARTKVVEWILEFKDSFLETKVLPSKGLYLYGQFGVGKTHILATIANEFAKLNVPSLIVYTPELFRELKANMGQANLESRLENIKKVPILMFDDLGSEMISAWVRDEILGSILQYRMANELPVFISTNFTYDELMEQISSTEYGTVDELKAGRILERIKALTTPIQIEGRNRRIS